VFARGEVNEMGVCQVGGLGPLRSAWGVCFCEVNKVGIVLYRGWFGSVCVCVSVGLDAVRRWVWWVLGMGVRARVCLQ
jgi:tetrahydromethanopterin S-methyltransferase subunit C